MEAEIVVVGAGPGGSMAATVLARHGHDVLLLDRHDFPRDKICGDAVPAGALQLMKKAGMTERIRVAHEAGHFHPVDDALLVSPRNHKLIVPFVYGDPTTKSVIAPRIHLDALLQSHAVESGARFVQGQVTGPVVEEGVVRGVTARINGREETIHARAVVAADGVTSVIARALRAPEDEPQDSHRAVALRAYIEDLDFQPERIEFYFYREILPGYAWIFPTGTKEANIGLGMRLDHFRKRDENLKQMLHTFLEMPDIKKRLRRGGVMRGVHTWQLNFGSQSIQRAFNGCLLVGDAAGLINPLTGGGIDNAIISANFAAETLHDALQKGDLSREALSIYEQRTHEELKDGMRTSYLVQRWLNRVPFLIDFVFKYTGGKGGFAETLISKL